MHIEKARIFTKILQIDHVIRKTVTFKSILLVKVKIMYPYDRGNKFILVKFKLS